MNILKETREPRYRVFEDDDNSPIKWAKVNSERPEYHRLDFAMFMTKRIRNNCNLITKSQYSADVILPVRMYGFRREYRYPLRMYAKLLKNFNCLISARVIFKDKIPNNIVNIKADIFKKEKEFSERINYIIFNRNN